MSSRTLLASLLALSSGASAQVLGSPDSPASFFWADLDGDGLEDAYVIAPGGSGRLLRNRGDGSLEDVTAASGLADLGLVRFAAWQDVDGDHDQDLLIGGLAGPSRLFANQGRATFADVTASAGLAATAAARHAGFLDYDHDGRPDLHLATESESLLFHNLGAGLFERVELALPAAAPAAASAVPAARTAGGEPVSGASAPAAGASRSAATGKVARPDSPPTSVPGRIEVPGAGLSTSVDAIAFPACALALRDQDGSGCLYANSVPTLGQLYPLSSNLFVSSSTGFVGCGTTNPLALLHLRGTGTTAALRLNTTSNDGTSKVQLLENDNTSALVGGQVAYDGALDELQLSGITAGVALPQLVVERPTGDVGIGTTNPGRRLHVVGTGDPLVQLESGNTTATRLLFQNTDQGTYSYDLGVTGSAATFGQDCFLIRDVTAGSLVRFLIDPTGKVGVGTGTPTEQLDVAGNLRVAGDIHVDSNRDITGLDELVGFDNLRLSGDDVGGPDLFVNAGGTCGVGGSFSNVKLNVTGDAGTTIVFNAHTSAGVNAFQVQDDQDTFVFGDFYVQNGSKNFILDHPLDPANESLAHNAVEGPGYYTFYRGNVVLGPQGEAWVELPDYFDALNIEPSYQLTCVGGSASVYVADEVRDHRFRIAGGRPGLKVSWQVTGLRNDPYARDNPYQDVIQKQGAERGRYHYAAGYGAPAALEISRIPGDDGGGD